MVRLQYKNSFGFTAHERRDPIPIDIGYCNNSNKYSQRIWIKQKYISPIQSIVAKILKLTILRPSPFSSQPYIYSNFLPAISCISIARLNILRPKKSPVAGNRLEVA